jgi:O-antigen/teichoic acid export membrane protein
VLVGTHVDSTEARKLLMAHGCVRKATTPNPISRLLVSHGGGFLFGISAGREVSALADQALVSGANFLTFALLGRALGVSEFGVFAICWSVVLLVSGLQMALIVAPMMSIGPKQDPVDSSAYYGAVTIQEIWLVLLSFLCVYAGTHAFAFCFPVWKTQQLAVPLAGATAAYLAQDYGRRFFFTIRRNSLAIATDALSYLTQLPILWWMVRRHQLTSTKALWIIALTSCLGVLLSLFWLSELRFDFRMMRTVAARHWKLSRWLAPSAVLQWSSLNVFMISAPVYYGPAAAGALRACQNIVGISHVWFLGLDNVIPVEAARRLQRHSLEALFRYLVQTIVRWGLLTAVFMLIICAAPSFWLQLVYGARYEPFGNTLRLYGVLYLMIFLGGPLRAGLQAFEYTAPLLWSYLVMTLFAAIVAAPLAKLFGLAGVMYGLIATQIMFQALLATALINRALRVRGNRAVLRPRHSDA